MGTDTKTEKPKRQKTGGRQKGTKNKVNRNIEQIFAGQNFNPAEGLAYCFIEAVKLYKRRVATRSTFKAGEALSIAAKVANDAAQYVYPKRKAIEHTGANGEKLLTSLADVIGALDLSDDKDEQAGGE